MMRYLDTRIGDDPLARIPSSASADPQATLLLSDEEAEIPQVLPFPRKVSGPHPGAEKPATIRNPGKKSPAIRPAAASASSEEASSPLPVVLHVCHASPSGALEEELVRQAAAVDRSRFHPMLALVHPPNWQPLESVQRLARTYQLPLLFLTGEYPLDWRPARALRELCQQTGVRLWIAHDIRSDLLGTWIHRTHPLERLANLHGVAGSARTQRWLQNLRLRLLPWTSGQVLTPSAVLQAEAERNQRLDPIFLHHVPPAVDLQNHQRQRTRAEARRHLHVARDRRIIGLAGVLDEQAGVEKALEMMAAFAPYRDHIDLHVLGDGPAAGRLKTLALRLGLTERVHWWGRLDDAREHYELFDLLLVPTASECLASSTLQAMALGVPVAARHTQIMNELLDQGRCGLLLQGEDPHAWAPQVIALLADREQRQAFIRRSLRHLQRHHVLDAHSRRTSRLLDSLLGRRNHPAPALRKAA